MVFLRGRIDDKEARREVQDETVRTARQLSHHYILEPIGKLQNTTASQEDHGEAEGFMKENKPLIVLPPGPVIIDHNETQDSAHDEGDDAEEKNQEDSTTATAGDDSGEDETEDDTTLPFDDHDSGEDKVAAMIAEMQAEMQAEAAGNATDHATSAADTEDTEDGDGGKDQFIGAPDTETVDENATKSLPWELDDPKVTQSLDPVASTLEPADDVDPADSGIDLDDGDAIESESVLTVEGPTEDATEEGAVEDQTNETQADATLEPADKVIHIEPKSVPSGEEGIGDVTEEDETNVTQTLEKPASTVKPVDDASSGGDFDKDVVEPKGVPTGEQPVLDALDTADGGEDGATTNTTETTDAAEPPIRVSGTDAPSETPPAVTTEEVGDGSEDEQTNANSPKTSDKEDLPIESTATDSPSETPPTTATEEDQDGKIENDQEPTVFDEGEQDDSGNDTSEPGETPDTKDGASTTAPASGGEPVETSTSSPTDSQLPVGTSPSPTQAPSAQTSIIVHPNAQGNVPNPADPPPADDSPIAVPTSGPPDISKVSHDDAPEPKEHEEQPHSESTGTSDGGQSFGSLCRHPNGLAQQVNCKLILGVQSHPFAFSGALLMALVWACCLCRRACKGRGGREDNRGEYREVAAQYDDVLFQDTFDDNYSASFGDDRSADGSIMSDEAEDDWTKGPNIEMSTVPHKEDNLSLEEMNG